MNTLEDVQGGINFGARVHTVGTNPASSAEQRRKDALASGLSPAFKAKTLQEPGAATVDTLDQAQKVMRQVILLCHRKLLHLSLVLLGHAVHARGKATGRLGRG